MLVHGGFRVLVKCRPQLAFSGKVEIKMNLELFFPEKIGLYSLK